MTLCSAGSSPFGISLAAALALLAGPAVLAVHAQGQNSAPAQSQTLVDAVAEGQWATGSAANCKIAKKVYTLTSDGRSISWRDGMGNVDIEALVSSSDNGFSSVTLHSYHSPGPGERLGTAWTYTKIAPDVIRVSPSGKNSFLLVRCGP
ncbi:MAG: hypothetical protein ACLPIX_12925 [Rhodomicrobium sp.]